MAGSARAAEGWLVALNTLLSWVLPTCLPPGQGAGVAPGHFHLKSGAPPSPGVLFLTSDQGLPLRPAGHSPGFPG